VRLRKWWLILTILACLQTGYAHGRRIARACAPAYAHLRF
jgi:hypothetical protein